MSVIRREVWAFTRTLVVALLTAILAVGGLQVAFGARSQAQLEAAEKLALFQRRTFNATLAEACVLALPIEGGRSPELVQKCFTQYGLEPPIVLTEEDM